MVAFLALGLGLWAFVFQARLSVLSPELDLSEVAWPARIEGVEVGSEDQARFQVEGFAVGTEVTFEIPESAPGSRPGTVALEAAHSRPYLLVTLISGLFFWSVGAMVFAPRVDQPAVPLFFWISILYGTGVLVGGVYGQSAPLGISLLRPLMQLTSLAFLPAAFLHLSLAFPADTPLLTRRPWLPLVPYLLAAFAVVWQSAVFLDYFRHPGPEAWSGLKAPQVLADGLMVLQVVAGFSVFVTRAGRLVEARQRQQVRWLILGFVVGSAPYVFLRTLPNLFGAPALFPAYFDRILELAVPTGFIFAVVRYRFLNIDIILRRGLIYGFLAAGLVVVVVLPVLLLGPDWTDPWPGWWRVIVISCGLVAGILFRPLHGIIGRGVDRAFFKIEREMENASRALQAGLDGADDPRELAERLQSGLREFLHLDHCGVVVADGPEFTAVGDGNLEAAAQWWARESADGAADLSLQGRTDIWAETGFPRASLPDPMAEAGFVAVHALTAGEKVLGAIFLGPKKTGRLFIPSDHEFLLRAAEAAGRRLDQIHLARTAAGERMKRRQLDELSRLKDDFLSRVAHDLRTPVTSLGWSIRNLNDGLAGELNEKQKEYLSSIRDAVDHLAGLVTNLLEISRLEKSRVEVACELQDLQRAVQRAAGTVDPLAEAKGVKLETTITGTVTALVDEDKLTEVLVNLLENAVRFSPSGGEVTLKVESPDQDTARITIRDQGQGLGGLADPFDRFVQGEPSPDGSRGGYGLGLTIAREYVELMGGEITGGDHPDGGAVFSIDLERIEKSMGDRS
ncbi:MAG: HAMP domain-containing sensor histidine kinase [Candidatus Krumholzibacteriota bacterium]